MNRKLIFVLFAVLMMAVMTASVSADQLANDRWCNSDQYGCWITGDEGAQVYIMFWSESARDLFMGPGSNAVVTDPYPAGKMPLDPAPAPEKTFISLEDFIRDFWNSKIGTSDWFTQETADLYSKWDIDSYGKWKSDTGATDSQAIAEFLDDWGNYGNYQS